jgi:hypothetical protein
LRIDHVILASSDLDASAERVEAELGVQVAGGGRHEGLGTHNRIVPLGGGYLEILAVADPEEAESSPLGRALAARIAKSSDGLMGWAVAVDDIEPVVGRLETEVSTISRQGLSARLTGVAEAMAEPFLPFFISRDHGIPDPGEGADAGGIEWIEVSGSAPRLGEWLGGEELPVRVVEGPSAVRAVGIGGKAFG